MTWASGVKTDVFYVRVTIGYYCERSTVVGMRDVQNDVSCVAVRSVSRQYMFYRWLSIIGSFYLQKAFLSNYHAVFMLSYILFEVLVISTRNSSAYSSRET